jgi:branched-chain amino acid transport system substrate-binding protein
MRHNLNKLLFVLVIAAMILTACGPTQANLEQKPKLPSEIVVGVVQPLTGTFAVFGNEGKLGAEMAINDINAAGGIKSMGGLKLKIAVEDAGENADSAKLATESMISKNHPVAILGLYISRFVMAASEVTDREKVILLADALVPQITQMGRQYLFRPGQQPAIMGRWPTNS